MKYLLTIALLIFLTGCAEPPKLADDQTPPGTKRSNPHFNNQAFKGTIGDFPAALLLTVQENGQVYGKFRYINFDQEFSLSSRGYAFGHPLFESDDELRIISNWNVIIREDSIVGSRIDEKDQSKLPISFSSTSMSYAGSTLFPDRWTTSN